MIDFLKAGVAGVTIVLFFILTMILIPIAFLIALTKFAYEVAMDTIWHVVIGSLERYGFATREEVQGESNESV